MACDEVRDLARVEAARQLAAHVEQPAELAGEVLRAGEQSRRLERGRGLVGEDRQQPLVLGAELAQPELRERDHADDRPVVAHRDDEHRFVDVVGPFDRHAAWVGVGVVHEERLAVQRDPAREALAHLAAQEIEVDIVVGADHALEGDRDDVAERLDQVHPGVVVVDDAAGLLDDGPPDLLDGVLAVHPGGRRLEDRELGGPRRGLLDELAVEERDRGMRCDGADERDVVRGPIARRAGRGGENTDRLAVAHERRDQVALGDRPAGAQHLADRALVKAGQRQSSGRILIDARRGNDGQLVPCQETDRHFVGAERDPRLLGDRRQELGAFVRRGEARADLADALEVPAGLGRGICGGRDLRLRRVAGSGRGLKLSVGPGRARVVSSNEEPWGDGPCPNQR